MASYRLGGTFSSKYTVQEEDTAMAAKQVAVGVRPVRPGVWGLSVVKDILTTTSRR